MNLRDLVWILLRDNRRRVWQTLTVVVALAMGAVALIVSTSVARMAQASAREDLERLGSNILQIDARDSDPAVQVLTRSRVAEIETINTVGRAAALAGMLDPRVEHSCGDEASRVLGAQVSVVDPHFSEVVPIVVGAGRWLDSANEYEVVVGSNVRSAFSAPAGLGTVCINGRSFPIVGTLAEPTGFSVIDDSLIVAWPASDLERPVREAYLRVVGGPDQVDETTDLLSRVLSQPGARPKIQSSGDLLAASRTIDERLDLLSFGLTLFIFVITAVASGSSALLGVRQQAGELGLIMAFGRSQKSIVAQFVAAGFVRGLVAVAVAIPISLTSLACIGIVLDWPVRIHRMAVAGSILGVLASSTLSALVAAAVAARLVPKEVLRGR